MEVKVLTLSGVKFSSTAKEVMLRTTEGDMVILTGHEPFMGVIEPGALTIIDDKGNDDVFSVFGGVVNVSSDSQVKILVDEAEHVDDLIEEEIKQALQLAHDLKESAKDRHALSQAQDLVDRHSVRLNVARVRRRKQKN
ncbi:ATP synthase F1 subunit epsilon [Candidatus Saccharibacteria bacterium]|jgi:F-type H+-transporting ATPase subunit epsilon|nr:ATP synthase F1 subunit epsilon [Candidatus Saccharibacteria bacterium]MBP7834636.1 ATP synthase F1 subunit epsilon [Candidatus Saccharibacteria bacterium]